MQTSCLAEQAGKWVVTALTGQAPSPCHPPSLHMLVSLPEAVLPYRSDRVYLGTHPRVPLPSELQCFPVPAAGGDTGAQDTPRFPRGGVSEPPSSAPGAGQSWGSQEQTMSLCCFIHDSKSVTMQENTVILESGNSSIRSAEHLLNLPLFCGQPPPPPPAGC